jgi:hypothetical protein
MAAPRTVTWKVTGSRSSSSRRATRQRDEWEKEYKRQAINGSRRLFFARVNGSYFKKLRIF